MAARATRDLDIGLCAPAEDLLPIFDRALAVGFEDFRLRRRGEARVLGNGIRSLEVAVEYVGRPFAGVEIDLGQADLGVPTDPVEPIALYELGLAQPRPVPCLAITEQIAQKFHALTEPMPRNHVNGRARDVLDILLLDERLELDVAAIAQACVRVFAQRATHVWPLWSFSFPAEWSAMLAELTRQVGYGITDVRVIETRFNTFLARLNGAPNMPLYEYEFMTLEANLVRDPQEHRAVSLTA